MGRFINFYCCLKQLSYGKVLIFHTKLHMKFRLRFNQPMVKAYMVERLSLFVAFLPPHFHCSFGGE
jgi:hypothetical protein